MSGFFGLLRAAFIAASLVAIMLSSPRFAVAESTDIFDPSQFSSEDFSIEDFLANPDVLDSDRSDFFGSTDEKRPEDKLGDKKHTDEKLGDKKHTDEKLGDKKHTDEKLGDRNRFDDTLGEGRQFENELGEFLSSHPQRATKDSDFTEEASEAYHDRHDAYDGDNNHDGDVIKVPEDGDFMFFTLFVNSTTVEFTHANVSKVAHDKVLFLTPLGHYLTDKFEISEGDESTTFETASGEPIQLLKILQNNKTGIFFNTPDGNVGLLNAKLLKSNHSRYKDPVHQIKVFTKTVENAIHDAAFKLQSFLKHYLESLSSDDSLQNHLEGATKNSGD